MAGSPRIRLYYMESTGAGHRRAAEAIEKELAEQAPRADVRLVNIIDHMNQTVHQMYQGLRNRIMEDAPHVFGQLYAWADKPAESKESFLERTLRGLELSSLRSLMEYMKTEPCDLAIHTHFFPAEIAAYLRRKAKVSFPHVTVTTDYFSHALWSQDPCELFFVASDDAATYLSRLGVSEDRIRHTGIPIDPEFERMRVPEIRFDAETELRMEAIRSGNRKPTVMLTTNGTPPEVAAQNLQDLLRAERPLRVWTLAGGDAERLEALNGVVCPERHDLQVFGPRSDIPRFLAEADLTIGKAGGLTCAEAMAMGCPLAFLKPRPDQEAQNADLLLEAGAATRILRSALLGPNVDRLFEEPERWARLRRRAHQLGRADAARQVVRHCLPLCCQDAPQPEEAAGT